MTNPKPDIEQFEELSKRFSIIPLKGKAPIEKEWQKWCNKKRQFNRKDFIGKNAGVACGKASGVLVLDVDDKEKFEKFLKDNNYSLPETYQVQTGNGGTHYYFKYPEE